MVHLADVRSSRPFAAVLLLASLLSPHPVAATEIVGAIGAANGSPTGRLPDAPQRVLKPGDDVFFKDRIATKAGGSAQVTFLDRSTLNIGENSDVTIDEFVYRPGQAGSMRAKLKKGFLRYVGGDISHGGGATVATPTVTIGIRGGIGLIATVTDGARLAGVPGVPRDFTGGTIVVNAFGTLTVHNSVSETVISRPGFAAFVSSSDAPISAPVRFDMAAAQALTKALGSRKGQTGGASAKVHAAAAQVVAARLPSMDLPVAHSVAVPLNGLDYTAVFSAANSLARVRSQAGQSVQLQQQLGGISAVHEATSPVTTASPGSTPATTPVATGPATAPAATTTVGSMPATAPVTTMPSTMPVATAPETTPPVTASATTPVISMPTTAPVTNTPATTTGATAPAAPATTMSEMTTTPVAATSGPALETTPVAKAPAASPILSAPVPTLMPTPVTTPLTGLPAKSVPIATQPTPTPVVTAPATSAAQPGGFSIPVPGGTITIGNQGVAFTPSTGTATTTISTPIPVATTPAPLTIPRATTEPGHDNGAGNGFANNGHGNGR